MSVQKSVAAKADPNVDIIGVPKDRLFELWPVLQSYLHELEGITQGRISSDDMLLDVLAGDCALWLIYSPLKKHTYAVAVTRVLKYPNLKSVLMEFCGGSDAHLWFAKAEAELVEYARSVGADMVEALGRRGWMRLLGDDWSSERVMLTKRV